MTDLISCKLTVNSLNEDMIKMAKEHGYKIPAVGLRHHFGKTAAFININNKFSLEIFRENALVKGDDSLPTHVYLIAD